MKQEDKELLLKDICARLPYGVKCYTYTIGAYCKKNWTPRELTTSLINLFIANNDYIIMPYLRPMSSMTDKEKKEFENLLEGIVDGIERWDKPDLCEDYDWLNAHHFDYRGLIPKGLALEAKE